MHGPPSWPALPWPPVLGDGEVHVVRFDLAREHWRAERHLLSRDERSRASRFAFDDHRRRFVAGRAALRRILGAYLGANPRRLAFTYSPHGRPGLFRTGGPALDFNLAHSEDQALLAVATSSVGVDLERLQAPPDLMDIARHYFSEREVSALERLRPESRDHGFFCAWTRKEALLKASGLGVSALRQVEVSLEAAPAVLAAPGGASAWSLSHLEPAPGFVGALALGGHGRKVCCWEWRWR